MPIISWHQKSMYLYKSYVRRVSRIASAYQFVSEAPIMLFRSYFEWDARARTKEDRPVETRIHRQTSDSLAGNDNRWPVDWIDWRNGSTLDYLSDQQHKTMDRPHEKDTIILHSSSALTYTSAHIYVTLGGSETCVTNSVPPIATMHFTHVSSAIDEVRTEWHSRNN